MEKEENYDLRRKIEELRSLENGDLLIYKEREQPQTKYYIVTKNNDGEMRGRMVASVGDQRISIDEISSWDLEMLKIVRLKDI